MHASDQIPPLGGEPLSEETPRRPAPPVVMAAAGAALLLLAGLFAVWLAGPRSADPQRPRGMAAPLPRTLTPEIRQQLAKMTSGAGRTAMLRAVERSRSMRDHAERVFVEEGVPPELVWLAHVESGWRSDAVSPASAAGVWQFIPTTAVRFGLKVEDGVDERFDFEKQTRAAARYLRFLYDRYDGNWELAIGAYNCGEGRMDRAVAAGGSRDFWTLRRRGLVPRETADYVPKVLAASLVGTDPKMLAR